LEPGAQVTGSRGGGGGWGKKKKQLKTKSPLLAGEPLKKSQAKKVAKGVGKG